MESDLNFSEAKILIAIRNQIHFLQSFFPQMLMSSNHYVPLKVIAFKEYIDLNFKLAREAVHNIFKINTEFEDHQLAFLKNYFVASNAKMTTLLNRDLWQWNYP